MSTPQPPAAAELKLTDTIKSLVNNALAAGKPIVSTPLDELRSLTDSGLVTVVHADRFIAGVGAALREVMDPAETALRRLTCDTLLARTSWDRTCRAMMQLMEEAAMTRRLAGASGMFRADRAPCHGAAGAIDEIAEELS